MKKILIPIYFIVLNVALYAQSYTSNVDSKLKFIDNTLLKSGGTDNNNVPTGKLYDRAYPFAQLHDFNSTIVDTSCASIFYQAYSEIIQSTYYDLGLKTVDQVETIAESIKNGNKNIVPIGILNQDFNYLDPNALEKNTLRLDGEDLYRGSNTSESPFLLKKLVMLSPLSMVAPQSLQYTFSSDLVMQQANCAINKIEADFADGLGFRTISIPQSVSIKYSTKGLKVIQFKVTLCDGRCILTNGAIYSDDTYFSTTPSTGSVSTFKIQASIPFQGYDEANPSKGIGDVKVFFATGNSTGKVKKPIIILDGFDPQDTRTAQKVYDLLNIEAGMLADTLLKENYDIVILNFPKYKNEQGKEIDGGADYIERNAMVLVTLLQKINQDKPASEQNVVIGPSMGGLISRYALAYMEQREKQATTPEEKEKWKHQVRLWISFDSPHNGANIPAGLQKLVSRLSGINEAAKKSRDLQLKSAAAKQMLISHFDANSEYQLGAPFFRDRFVNVLNDIGYPHNLRKIAVVNGSLNGTLTNIPTDKIFTLEVSYKALLLFWRIKTYTALTARPYFTSGNGSRSKILDLNLIGGLDNTDTYLRSDPYSQSLDNSPGGTFNTQKIISDTKGEASFRFDNKKFGGWLSNVSFGSIRTTYYSLKDYHCFIPTKSALGFTGSNKDLAESVYNRDLVASKETPFDSYYGPIDKNMEHVSLDKDMVQYVLDEIHGIKRNPRTSKNDMKDAIISGPNVLCSANPGFFTLDNIPQVSGITWTKSTNLNFVGSSTGTSVTVQPATTTGGDAWVEATVTYNGEPFNVARKTFWIGKPSTPTDISGLPTWGRTFSSGEEEEFCVSHLSNQGVNSYEWVASNATLLSGQGTRCASIRAPQSVRDGRISFRIKVRVGNSCGYSPYLGRLGYVGGSGGMYIVYPNPSSSEVTIEPKKNMLQPEVGSRDDESDRRIKSIRILDVMGNLKKQYRYTGEPSVKLNISDLPMGYYVILVNGTGKCTVLKQQ